MKPVLWGPPLWQCLFGCAWNCPVGSEGTLRALLLHQMPALLPCGKCRTAYSTRHLPKVRERLKVQEPRTAAEAFTWLYTLRDEVNRSLREEAARRNTRGAASQVGRGFISFRTVSPPFEDIVERHELHGGSVDDVAAGDMLVLVALAAHDNQRDDVFVELCKSLADLLPLPSDSQFASALRAVSRPIVRSAVQTARAARVERGLPVYSLAHYRKLSE